MVEAQLLELALRARKDRDARIVLADAIHDVGWYDERIITNVLLPVPPTPRPATKKAVAERRALIAKIREEGRTAFLELVAQKTNKKLAHAVVAVLLFKDFRARPWPVWYRHRRNGTTARLAHQAELHELGRALAASIAPRIV